MALARTFGCCAALAAFLVPAAQMSSGTAGGEPVIGDRCTNQIDYSGDPRSNAEINSIGASTGVCPRPITGGTSTGSPVLTVDPSYLAGQESGQGAIEFFRALGDMRTFSTKEAQSECAARANNLIIVVPEMNGFIKYSGGRIPYSQIDWDAFRSGCTQGILSTQ